MANVLGKRAKNHRIQTIIDIGASNGSWTELSMKYFPDAAYFLIEAQPVHLPALKGFSSLHQNVDFILAAAGDEVGEIHFLADAPLSGQASHTAYSENDIVVPVTTVDHEISSRKLKGPFLLKLDTHGFEAPIFKGASQTLKETEVIIVECYNFKLGSDCLLFYEMCIFLGERGFRCIDITDPLWRPGDDAFWQIDMVFVRNDRPEFSHNNYQ
jgi:FkbM family methyltransferase